MLRTDKMIGLAEAAAVLHVPYQTAHRLLLTGKLRGEKRDGRWFVHRADVDQVRIDLENSGKDEFVVDE